MADSAQALPRFNKPPVIETVLGVHFRPVEKLTSAHQGLLWDQCFRSKFPKLEERPPLAEMREQFGEERLVGTPPIRWQVQDRPDVPRLWATSDSGEHVVQIQRSAFFANWLKTSTDAAYRPFSDRRDEFNRQLTDVERFVRDQELGQIKPTSCVVTYINYVDFSGFDEVGAALARLLTCSTNETSDGWLPDPDNAAMNLAFPMPDNAGRLNVAVAPVVRRDGNEHKHALRLDLTARGAVTTGELADAMAWIDLGHEWVVRSFASVTRPEMHGLWEREQ